MEYAVQKELAYYKTILKDNPTMVYPKFDIVKIPHNKIIFRTFVKSEDRYIYVEEVTKLKEFVHTEYLKTLIDNFTSECKKVRLHGIFNENTSITKD
ncbi:MAG: hypothetical protein ACTH0S_06670 [Senegalia sp. (in: firmicutes)]